MESGELDGEPDKVMNISASQQLNDMDEAKSRLADRDVATTSSFGYPVR